MRKTKHSVRFLALLSLLVMGSATQASPIILTNAIQTLTLDSGVGLSHGSNVAYNPLFDRYYTSKIGGNDPFYVFDGSGALVQTVSNINNLPSRAINYNANTGNLEAVTYNAKLNSSSTQGLFSLGLDASGNYDGSSVELLTQVPGIQNTQPIVAYDSVTNRLFSNDGAGGSINIIDRATGNLQSTIMLEVTGLGTVDIAGYAIGYDEANGVLVSYDRSGKRALVHDVLGNLLGSSLLPPGSNDPGSYSVGYANNTFFLHSQGVWQGFQVLETAVPAPPAIMLFCLGLFGLVVGRRKISRQT